MELESCVPPGFRFHPTEEELVGYYLKRKVNSLKIDLDVITDIDLYRIEPWDIQDSCKLGYEEQNEWYFFSHKDRKYPTGTRTNRATAAGFWKATGRDKAVLSKERIIGMRKTLVFYRGRAPNGRKTDWIMHEYRLQTSEHAPPQEEGWVVCRAFKKPSPNHNKQGYEAWHSTYHVRDNNYLASSYSSSQTAMLNLDPMKHMATNFQQSSFSPVFQNQIAELPNLDSPSGSTSFVATKESFDHNAAIPEDTDQDHGDWKNFDKFLASQVSEPSSYAYPNIPLGSHYGELDAQNHVNHVFECLSDL